MAKTISFVVLVSLTLLVGAVFFAVMRQFVLPLFLALLLVIMFRPLHEWFEKKFPKHPRITAGLTTMSIILIVLAPLLFVLAQAGMEAVAVAQSTDPDEAVAVFQRQGAHLTQRVRDWASRVGVEVPPDGELARNAASAIRDNIAPAAVRTTQFVGSFLFGLAIMLISMYYFFADGKEMIDAVVRLTPMDEGYLRHLFTEFGKTSRAVVLATLLAALGQGVLGGIAYFLVGMPHLFLLSAATAFIAIVPFVGASIIWAPCVLWLYFAAGKLGAAIFLAIWGVAVIGMSDNFIKPYVLQGQSNVHPLLALLSVIGGAQALGLIGIFVGPMVVSLLYALLILLQGQLSDAELTEKSARPMA
jgi:predicted PurR-regulated permease PerM